MRRFHFSFHLFHHRNCINNFVTVLIIFSRIHPLLERGRRVLVTSELEELSYNEFQGYSVHSILNQIILSIPSKCWKILYLLLGHEVTHTYPETLFYIYSLYLQLCKTWEGGIIFHISQVRCLKFRKAKKLAYSHSVIDWQVNFESWNCLIPDVLSFTLGLAAANKIYSTTELSVMR